MLKRVRKNCISLQCIFINAIDENEMGPTQTLVAHSFLKGSQIQRKLKMEIIFLDLDIEHFVNFAPDEMFEKTSNGKMSDYTIR